jgi:hypothetical protein
VAALIASSEGRSLDPACGGLPGAGGVPLLVLQVGQRRLAGQVARLFTLHEGKYVPPRITADLKDVGWRVSEKPVTAFTSPSPWAGRVGAG